MAEADHGGQDQPRNAQKRKPVPGKGFGKTRRGCFNCKRRRVKCSECRPECKGCRRLGMHCVYPATTLPQVRHSIASTPSRANLSLDHLRFFHHFLIEAYPPHPHASSAVWQDVAALSHEYNFLASSLLALAAQHLTLFNHANYSVQALDLRVSAINGLNHALSRPCRTAAEADARYAAVIALTFQSSYMPDGMMDFLAMMRGWMLIQTTLVADHTKSMFCTFTRESFVGSMERYIEQQGNSGNDTLIQDCLASLKTVEPLCRGNAERRYWSMLERLAQLSTASPRDAFLEMVPCYALTNKMTEDEYAGFTDPSNHVAQVLLAHFLMLDHVLETCFSEATTRHFAFSKGITKAWINNIASALPKSFLKYMMWPLGLAKSFRESPR
ncbi:Zn(2)-C6 fungal-type domain-containing protein [Fusarium sp. LHS14.1]|nr:Zn(2)-C6 fungal-type domain-containing protein [Fusarium sp. LHS14.1]